MENTRNVGNSMQGNLGIWKEIWFGLYIETSKNVKLVGNLICLRGDEHIFQPWVLPHLFHQAINPILDRAVALVFDIILSFNCGTTW